MKVPHFTPLAIAYSLDIEMAQFERLLAIDKEASDRLYCLLEQIPGVKKVDYDGHFGNTIFLSIDTEYGLDFTQEQIMKVIAERLTHVS